MENFYPTASLSLHEEGSGEEEANRAEIINNLVTTLASSVVSDVISVAVQVFSKPPSENITSNCSSSSDKVETSAAVHSPNDIASNADKLPVAGGDTDYDAAVAFSDLGTASVPSENQLVSGANDIDVADSDAADADADMDALMGTCDVKEFIAVKEDAAHGGGVTVMSMQELEERAKRERQELVKRKERDVNNRNNALTVQFFKQLLYGQLYEAMSVVAVLGTKCEAEKAFLREQHSVTNAFFQRHLNTLILAKDPMEEGRVGNKKKLSSDENRPEEEEEDSDLDTGAEIDGMAMLGPHGSDFTAKLVHLTPAVKVSLIKVLKYQLGAYKKRLKHIYSDSNRLFKKLEEQVTFLMSSFPHLLIMRQEFRRQHEHSFHSPLNKEKRINSVLSMSRDATAEGEQLAANNNDNNCNNNNDNRNKDDDDANNGNDDEDSNDFMNNHIHSPDNILDDAFAAASGGMETALQEDGKEEDDDDEEEDDDDDEDGLHRFMSSPTKPTSTAPSTTPEFIDTAALARERQEQEKQDRVARANADSNLRHNRAFSIHTILRTVRKTKEEEEREALEQQVLGEQAASSSAALATASPESLHYSSTGVSDSGFGGGGAEARGYFRPHSSVVLLSATKKRKQQQQQHHLANSESENNVAAYYGGGEKSSRSFASGSKNQQHQQFHNYYSDDQQLYTFSAFHKLQRSVDAANVELNNKKIKFTESSKLVAVSEALLETHISNQLQRLVSISDRLTTEEQFFANDPYVTGVYGTIGSGSSSNINASNDSMTVPVEVANYVPVPAMATATTLYIPVAATASVKKARPKSALNNSRSQGASSSSSPSPLSTTTSSTTRVATAAGRDRLRPKSASSLGRKQSGDSIIINNDNNSNYCGMKNRISSSSTNKHGQQYSPTGRRSPSLPPSDGWRVGHCMVPMLPNPKTSSYSPPKEKGGGGTISGNDAFPNRDAHGREYNPDHVRETEPPKYFNRSILFYGEQNIPKPADNYKNENTALAHALNSQHYLGLLDDKDLLSHAPSAASRSKSGGGLKKSFSLSTSLLKGLKLKGDPETEKLPPQQHYMVASATAPNLHEKTRQNNLDSDDELDRVVPTNIRPKGNRTMIGTISSNGGTTTTNNSRKSSKMFTPVPAELSSFLKKQKKLRRNKSAARKKSAVVPTDTTEPNSTDQNHMGSPGRGPPSPAENTRNVYKSIQRYDDKAVNAMGEEIVDVAINILQSGAISKFSLNPQIICAYAGQTVDHTPISSKKSPMGDRNRHGNGNYTGPPAGGSSSGSGAINNKWQGIPARRNRSATGDAKSSQRKARAKMNERVAGGGGGKTALDFVDGSATEEEEDSEEDEELMAILAGKKRSPKKKKKKASPAFNDEAAAAAAPSEKDDATARGAAKPYSLPLSIDPYSDDIWQCDEDYATFAESAVGGEEAAELQRKIERELNAQGVHSGGDGDNDNEEEEGRKEKNDSHTGNHNNNSQSQSHHPPHRRSSIQIDSNKDRIADVLSPVVAAPNIVHGEEEVSAGNDPLAAYYGLLVDSDSDNDIDVFKGGDAPEKAIFAATTGNAHTTDADAATATVVGGGGGGGTSSGAGSKKVSFHEGRNGTSKNKEKNGPTNKKQQQQHSSDSDSAKDIDTEEEEQQQQQEEEEEENKAAPKIGELDSDDEYMMSSTRITSAEDRFMNSDDEKDRSPGKQKAQRTHELDSDEEDMMGDVGFDDTSDLSSETKHMLNSAPPPAAVPRRKEIQQQPQDNDYDRNEEKEKQKKQKRLKISNKSKQKRARKCSTENEDSGDCSGDNSSEERGGATADVLGVFANDGLVAVAAAAAATDEYMTERNLSSTNEEKTKTKRAQRIGRKAGGGGGKPSRSESTTAAAAAAAAASGGMLVAAPTAANAEELLGQHGVSTEEISSASAHTMFDIINEQYVYVYHGGGDNSSNRDKTETTNTDTETEFDPYHGHGPDEAAMKAQISIVNNLRCALTALTNQFYVKPMREQYFGTLAKYEARQDLIMEWISQCMRVEALRSQGQLVLPTEMVDKRISYSLLLHSISAQGKPFGMPGSTNTNSSSNNHRVMDKKYIGAASISSSLHSLSRNNLLLSKNTPNDSNPSGVTLTSSGGAAHGATGGAAPTGGGNGRGADVGTATVKVMSTSGKKDKNSSTVKRKHQPISAVLEDVMGSGANSKKLSQDEQLAQLLERLHAMRKNYANACFTMFEAQLASMRYVPCYINATAQLVELFGKDDRVSVILPLAKQTTCIDTGMDAPVPPPPPPIPQSPFCYAQVDVKMEYERRKLIECVSAMRREISLVRRETRKNLGRIQELNDKLHTGM